MHTNLNLNSFIHFLIIHYKFKIFGDERGYDEGH